MKKFILAIAAIATAAPALALSVDKGIVRDHYREVV